MMDVASAEWVERKEAETARDEARAEVRRLRAMNERYAVQNTRLMEMLLPKSLSRAVRWLFGRGPR
jgi:hypothetical protein